MSARIFERLFHPKMMHDMVERNPEAALELIQAIHELGGDAELVWRRMDPELMERLLDPRYLLELSERSPEASISYARLLRERGGRRMAHKIELDNIQHFIGDFLERAIETPYLFELLERSPDAALEVVRAVRALSGRNPFLGQLHPNLVERFLDGRILLGLASRKPEAAVAMIQLIRELGVDTESSGAIWIQSLFSVS